MHDTICREGATPRRQARIEITEKHIKALTGERSVVDLAAFFEYLNFRTGDKSGVILDA